MKNIYTSEEKNVHAKIRYIVTQMHISMQQKTILWSTLVKAKVASNSTDFLSFC